MVSIDRIKSVQAASVQAVERIKPVEIARLCKTLIESRGTVYVLGNGGSQSNASHLVLHLRQAGIPAHDLLSDVAWLSAESNDRGYHGAPLRGFSAGYPPPGLVILISGSGNSQNCVALAKHFKNYAGIPVFGILGMDGGQLMSLCDAVIHIPSLEYSAVEDAASTVLHMIAAGVSAPVYGPDYE